MADDVVERLREEARFGWNLAANRQRDTRELHTEAADEIERLRAELACRSPSPDAEGARREAIEEAARLCDQEHRANIHSIGISLGSDARAMTAFKLAERIRALSPPVEGE